MSQLHIYSILRVISKHLSLRIQLLKVKWSHFRLHLLSYQFNVSEILENCCCCTTVHSWTNRMNSLVQNLFCCESERDRKVERIYIFLFKLKISVLKDNFRQIDGGTKPLTKPIQFHVHPQTKSKQISRTHIFASLVKIRNWNETSAITCHFIVPPRRKRNRINRP